MTTRQVQIDGEAWAKAAVLAYAGYTVKGPGAIVVDVLAIISPTPGAPALVGNYLSLEELGSQDWMSPDALADFPSYDPERQIVFIGRALNGDLVFHTARDDGSDTPRKLYDQLRKKVIGE